MSKQGATGGDRNMQQQAEELSGHMKQERGKEQSTGGGDERFRNLVETTSDVIWEADQNFVYTYVSPQILSLLGYRSSEVVGKKPFDFMPPREAEQARTFLEGIALRRKPFRSLENVSLHKFGYQVFVETSGIPFFDAEGLFMGYRGINRDITERRHAEETARKLAHAVEHSDEIIWMTDLDGKITYVNPAFERTYGYPKEEVLGNTPRILKSGLLNKEYYEEFWRTLLSGKSIRGEILNRTKSGGIITVAASVNPVFNPEGSITGFIAVQQDITEYKQAVEKIREQAALLDVATDAILVRRLDGIVEFWNKGAERLYKWKSDEIVGRNADEVLFKNGAEDLKEAKKTVTAKGVWVGELNQLTREGTPIVVESRWTLVTSGKEQAARVLVVNTDITDKKRLEEQFLRSQRLESIGTLAGGIAHDLNNVLAPILMSIDLLKRRVPDLQSLELLSTLESSTLRGADMVKQVLTFAKGIEGERIILGPGHLIREMAKIAAETFPKSIHVRGEVPEDLWNLSGDATQLHQVLLNLCVNARDAMPKGGVLTIGAENLILDEGYARMHGDSRPGPYVVIKISDSGEGIPPDIIDKIFEPFFTTKETGRGTGLGLSTVHSIVKSHGGFINVYSEIGKGTSFRVYLPAHKGAVALEPEEVEAPLPKGSGELILVIDDEYSVREITKETLETYGYRVLTASDGTDAIACYAERKHDIDLVLTDMLMPYLDGTATIRALRKLNPSLKIIAASGLSADGKFSEIAGAETVAFLSKPYTADKLLKVISTQLAKRSEPA